MNPSLRSALRSYGIVLGFVIFFGVLLSIAGDAPSLVAAKLCVVPMWWLSLGGLNAIYRQPIVEPRWTVRAVEHSVLGALVLCAFMAVMTWRPDATLAGMAASAGTLAAVFIPFQLLQLRGRIHRLRQAGV